MAYKYNAVVGSGVFNSRPCSIQKAKRIVRQLRAGELPYYAFAEPTAEVERVLGLRLWRWRYGGWTKYWLLTSGTTREDLERWS